MVYITVCTNTTGPGRNGTGHKNVPVDNCAPVIAQCYYCKATTANNAALDEKNQ